MKILVAGWFSFRNGHTTAGDLLAKDVACDWLEEAGFDFDVALAPPFTGGVDLQTAVPADYSHVVFVCGPFGPGELEAGLLERFATCRFIGLSLSLETPMDRWDPFDFLLERDSSRAAHPDLVFQSREPAVPVVGVCLVEPHAGARTAEAEAAIQRLLAARAAAVVPIDTRLDENTGGLRGPAEVESLIARMDLLITTRLHGMVLALKNGVPVIALDTIPGGAKISLQAATIGWPAVLGVERITDEAMREAFDYCLTELARARARDCAALARRKLGEARPQVLDALRRSDGAEEAYHRRVEAARVARASSTPAANGDADGWRLGRIGRRMIPGWVRQRLRAGESRGAAGLGTTGSAE